MRVHRRVRQVARLRVRVRVCKRACSRTRGAVHADPPRTIALQAGAGAPPPPPAFLEPRTAGRVLSSTIFDAVTLLEAGRRYADAAALLALLLDGSDGHADSGGRPPAV